MFRNLEQLAERLRVHVERLAASPRPFGCRAHNQAKQYIKDHLQQAGFTVAHDRHRLNLPPVVDFDNLLTMPVPADSGLPLLIVAAHFDTVPDSPGADDNASGVAALLELARWLARELPGLPPCKARLQLAAYDLEEMGILGSQLHSRKLRQAGTTLRGMISLEMLGFTDSQPGSQGLPVALQGMYPDVGNFIGIVGNQASSALVQAVTSCMKQVPGLPVEAMEVPDEGQILVETRLSDHSPFWDEGYPALMITDTSFFRNPHYHMASDRPETLDYAFLAMVTAGLCATVWHLLQGQDL